MGAGDDLLDWKRMQAPAAMDVADTVGASRSTHTNSGSRTNDVSWQMGTSKDEDSDADMGVPGNGGSRCPKQEKTARRRNEDMHVKYLHEKFGAPTILGATNENQ